MDKAWIDKWAKSFVTDLQFGGEAIPLDRVLARHLDTLSELRKYGLTWNALASIIARAGARRVNGRPISSDQLRANVARLRKRRKNGEISVPQTPDRASTQAPKRPERLSSPPTYRPPSQDEKSVRRPPELHSNRAPHSSKEISPDDIAAALSRIQAK